VPQLAREREQQHGPENRYETIEATAERHPQL